MAGKDFDWINGVTLEDHSKKKHEILKNYLRQYLITRCQLPQMSKFRLAVVDGFCGSGLYTCGSYGSPIIIVETIISALAEINTSRICKGFQPVDVECNLFLNDYDRFASESIKSNLSPFLIKAKEEKQLLLNVAYFNQKFETAYKEIKERVVTSKIKSVFFNLDQGGYSHVTTNIIRDILSSWRSAEILLTFMISSLLAYLSPVSKSNGVPLEPEIQRKIDAILKDGGLLGKEEWLGVAENIIYKFLGSCAHFVSPFSINNPNGWRYWLMHFANSHRARQVYNDILHDGGKAQAHYGRAGLKMLSYDPKNEGKIYLFDDNSREYAKTDLQEDIPKLLSSSGNILKVSDFYQLAYSETPAHSDDIHDVIIEHPDIQVVTSTGKGFRTKAHRIKIDDTLQLKRQFSLLF